jgi:hypothetical protein
MNTISTGRDVGQSLLSRAQCVPDTLTMFVWRLTAFAT